jgi:hypothetical protein
MIIESFPHWKPEDLGSEFTVTSIRFGEAQAMATAVRLMTDLRAPYRLVLIRTIGWPAMSGRIRYDSEAGDLAISGAGRSCCRSAATRAWCASPTG